MARWLKQSTSVDVPIGPFLDATDGVTAETALTITQPDIRLKKNGGNWAQKAAAQTLTHEENGNYEVTLDATDTNTLGLLRLHVSESGALPVWEDFVVVPANVWDSLFGADALQVHAVEITNDLITAAAIADNAIDAGAIATGAITSAKFAAGAIDAAAIAANAIGASELAADAVTEIQAGLSTLDAAGVRTAVGLASANLDTQLSAIDDFLDTEVAAIKAKTDNLPSDPADASDIAALIDALPTAAENAAALMDLANGVETSITPRQALRLILAAAAGKLSGAATTTVTIRNVGDSKDRITATVDADGNRSAVTTDAT
jgi:hypothetical protein